MSDSHTVLFSIDGGIATITLNRPERRNAINVATDARLKEIWDEIDKNDAIRVAILTGSDCGTFCAGMDLKEAAELRKTKGIDILEMLGDPSQPRMRAIKKPMIRVGMVAVTSATRSTSPLPVTAARASRQMARICGSSSAITDTRKVSASGRR